MGDRRSRRSVLGLVGSVGVGGTSGCLGGGESVSVLAAGSLAATVDDALGPRFREETGIAVRGEYHGTNALVRMVRDGQAHPDVAIGADVDLVRERLYPGYASWDVVFAANEVGLVYDPETEPGERLAAGEAWYEVVGDAAEGEVAIADPDLDPLGYRAIFLFELAQRRYDLAGFREAVVESAYLEPDEPRLLAGIETGGRAIAVAYRNMAVDRDLPFHELPDELNFSDPSYADRYGSVSYETDGGYVARGTPALYAATVPDAADDPDAGRAFVRFLLDSPDLLRERGLAVPGRLPIEHGEPPEGLA